MMFLCFICFVYKYVSDVSMGAFCIPVKSKYIDDVSCMFS